MIVSNGSETSHSTIGDIMSKISRRPNREDIKGKNRDNKKKEKELRRKLIIKGFDISAHSSSIRDALPNSKSELETIEEEIEERHTLVAESAKIYNINLKVLLNRLKKIPDPRNPKKLKHKLTVLMLYGILAFVYQVSSRREANRKMTTPIIINNMKQLFPELETIPHNDTLKRILERINVEEIEKAQIEMIRRLIRKKKFARYLINGHYPVAIDGTQKLVRDYVWSEECLERKSKRNKNTKTDQEEEKQYYVYVLEACLAFQNGMTIPLMSEFLSYTEGDTESKKQDCELKAFKRLAKRMKDEFPKLSILLLLDGLYPNGPVFNLCRNYKWDFMIVLQNDSLKSVWEEYNGLFAINGKTAKMKCARRNQKYKWVNQIHYHYNDGDMEVIHVVVCEENWEELDKDSGKIIRKQSCHAWISGKPLTERNLHERCNLGARHRWNIESGIETEKHGGYYYEHCFSYDWNAMKGYHYLMRIGHVLNVLVQFSEKFVRFVQVWGIRGLIRYIFETIRAMVLNKKLIKRSFEKAHQLRLL